MLSTSILFVKLVKSGKTKPLFCKNKFNFSNIGFNIMLTLFSTSLNVKTCFNIRNK